MMTNIYHKKSLHTGVEQTHVDPPPITLIKIKLNLKMEKEYVKLNCIEILRQKNCICMKLKEICLKIVSQRN